MPTFVKSQAMPPRSKKKLKRQATLPGGTVRRTLRDRLRKRLEKLGRRYQKSWMGRLTRLMGNTYKQNLDKHPYITNGLTSGALVGLGDFCAQRIEKRMTIQSPGKEGYNYTRTFRMMQWGVVAVGLILPWYRYLDVAGRSLKLSVWRTVAFKVGFDQLLFMPLFINVYFVFTGVLEGKTWGDIEVRLKDKVLPSWMTSLVFWGTWQTVNFRLVPSTMQPFVVFCGSVIWNTILSVMSHAEQYGTAAEREAEDKVAQLEGALAEAESLYKSKVATLEDQVHSLQLSLNTMQTHMQPAPLMESVASTSLETSTAKLS